jgi:phosphatidylinositol 4-kinase
MSDLNRLPSSLLLQVMHIDFGFLLTNSPGGNAGFEAAPFKLTAEMVAVLGGARSQLFNTFRKIAIRCYLAARRSRGRILFLVEIMLAGNADLPCFVGGPKAVMAGLRARFLDGVQVTDRAVVNYVRNRIITYRY